MQATGAFFAIERVILTGEQITINHISMVACASNRVNVSAMISAPRFLHAQGAQIQAQCRSFIL
ncbi:hypothetical protein XSR1_690004 [Xenorhabdus szentirmaii DSM 16338]|uniref:Uncharacterized protein n=1 Tax=Xenorhabdus szentirmaii DSM 16338 TaxID=1427518 RepID=W1J5V8_9GAMM|nr:hypothetical protein XSR1_690004 [Xenorhabdus szentirmaii DSM 16338]